MDTHELINKVREHKHNYAEDFGLAVSVPANAVFREFLTNPNRFSEKEAKRIIEIFTTAIECRALYENIGWPIDFQLNKVKNNMIPQIKSNSEFFSSLLSDSRPFKDPFLVSKLQMALNETDSLCDRLQNIEHFEYGKIVPFKIRALIKECFDKDNNTRSLEGHSPIQIEDYLGELSETEVAMNQEDFSSYVLGNIIKNLHDHAFKTQEVSSANLYEDNLPRWKTWLQSLLPDFIYKRFLDQKNESSLALPILEKHVRIRYDADEQNAKHINIYIENNGHPFTGDLESVFEEGVGKGTGIGLFSARQYLAAVGGKIEMFTSDNEFKVGFKINIPTL